MGPERPGEPEAETHDNPIIEHLLKRGRDLKGSYFTRAVTTFTDTEGRKYKAAVDQAEMEVERAGHVKVMLKSHEKAITMTLGGVLLAAGIIVLQRNRSQRKKMSNRASSYRRSPRKP